MTSKYQSGLANKPFLNDNFSPTLLAGLLTRNLPLKLVDIALQKFTYEIIHNHPGIMERLLLLGGKSFLICPTDLPHKIRLNFNGKDIKIFVEKSGDKADVRISGSLRSLIAMLDGSEDGDALFFSRKIFVEGDTEALVTLRNAIDSVDIKLEEEIGKFFGIFKKPVRLFMKSGQGVLDHLNKDMDMIHNALITPLRLRIDKIEVENRNLKKQIALIEKKLIKANNKILSLGRRISS